MTALSEKARAKVNLTLRVVGRRVDGYHDLESVVAFADCADTLSFEPANDLALTTVGPGAGECGAMEENLVLKAARLLGAHVEGLRTGHFRLEKHLPVAAGIGGGSADAAAALRLLARHNGIASDDPRLLETARLTGADVPVCVESRGCVMTGVGDGLMPVTLPQMPCVLVNPRVAVATKDVFAHLGLKPGALRVGIADVLKGAVWPKDDAPPDVWMKLLINGHNDLEAPALEVQPVIADVLAALNAQDGLRFSRMSGSGATCFAVFETAQEATKAAQAIRAANGAWWVHSGTLA